MKWSEKPYLARYDMVDRPGAVYPPRPMNIRCTECGKTILAQSWLIDKHYKYHIDRGE